MTNKIIVLPFNHGKYPTAYAQACEMAWRLKEDGLMYIRDYDWRVDDELLHSQKIYFAFKTESASAYYRLKWLDEVY